MFYISPLNVNYGQTHESRFTSRFRFSFKKNGDWDKKILSIEEHYVYRSLFQRYKHNADWQETPLYAQALEEIKKNTHYRGEYTNPEDLKKRFQKCDKLLNEIKEKGFKSNLELFRTSRLDDPFKLMDEVTVNLGRDGEILLNDGWHRFCIAKILKLEKIPVKLLIQHVSCKKIPASLQKN
jgi:hypothetical protein